MVSGLVQKYKAKKKEILLAKQQYCNKGLKAVILAVISIHLGRFKKICVATQFRPPLFSIVNSFSDCSYQRMLYQVNGKSKLFTVEPLRENICAIKTKESN